MISARNLQYAVVVDGTEIGKTSNYKYSVAQKDYCGTPEKCIKQGHSWGEFEIPSGTHSVLLHVDAGKRTSTSDDGLLRTVYYKIRCKW